MHVFCKIPLSVANFVQVANYFEQTNEVDRGQRIVKVADNIFTCIPYFAMLDLPTIHSCVRFLCPTRTNLRPKAPSVKSVDQSISRSIIAINWDQVPRTAISGEASQTDSELSVQRLPGKLLVQVKGAISD